MTDMKLMESKPHTHEVTGNPADVDISENLFIQTCCQDGNWYIQLVKSDDGRTVTLSGAEAVAMAEFITRHVRKRW